MAREVCMTEVKWHNHVEGSAYRKISAQIPRQAYRFSFPWFLKIGLDESHNGYLDKSLVKLFPHPCPV